MNDKVIEKIEYDRLAEKYPTGTDFITVYFQIAKENNASTECEYEYLITAPGRSFDGKIHVDFEAEDYSNDNNLKSDYAAIIFTTLMNNYDEYGPLPNGVIILCAE